MRFLFRVDAGPELGIGNLMRCITLAERLREASHEVIFVGRHSGDAAMKALHHSAYRGIALPESTPRPASLPYPEWRHPAQETEADDTLYAIRDLGHFDWLVVDAYALDAAWERRMRRAAHSIMVIDDLANRAHDCDVLLDQNFFLEPRRRYDGLVSNACRTLLGPHYALLRPEFAAEHAALKERSGVVGRVLVSFGGHDAFGLTRKALAAIEQADLARLQVDVVTDPGNPDFDAIERQCRTRGGWRLHASPDMARLMAQADLAIGAGGTMNWERGYLRLPCVLISIAENQERIASDLARHGACVYVGRAAEVSQTRLADVLRGLSAVPNLLRALGERAGAMVDGKGAQRVARRLMQDSQDSQDPQDPIELRAADASDATRIYEWRNAPETRRYALDPAPLELDSHVRWLGRVLADPQVELLIGEREGAALGVLRYDLDGETARVSIYLVPGHAGHGVGGSLIEAGTRWLRVRHPRIRRIVAEIRPENGPSLGAFSKAGFVVHNHVYRRELDHESN